MYQFVVLLVTFLVTVECRTVSTPNSNFTAQDRYIVSTDDKNWYQALLNCKIAGFKLVSIESAAQQAELESYLTENKYEGGFWTAGTNIADDTNWYWATTGHPVIYSKWAPGQPDHQNGEHCIMLGWRGLTSWNDGECTNKFRYICEKDSVSG